MNSRERVYTEILRELNKQMKSFAQHHLQVLAMMVAGLVFARKSHLNAMACELPTEAKPKSVEQRFRRFLLNPNVDEFEMMRPFAMSLLQQLRSRRLIFAFDGSALGRDCSALVVGVVFHQRVLPLSWLVTKGKKGQKSAAVHIQLLQQILPWIPPGSRCLWLADGEFSSVEVLDWIRKSTDWDLVFRLAKDTYVLDGIEVRPVQDSLAVQKEQWVGMSKTTITRKKWGPIHVFGVWEEEHEQPLYLVTTLEDFDEVSELYKLRFLIETLFSDAKSRGFGLDKSHLSDPKRLSRLLLAVSLAYIWMIRLGVEAIKSGSWLRFDREKRRDKSLFRLGCDFFKHLVVFAEQIPIFFQVHWLEELTDNPIPRGLSSCVG